LALINDKRTGYDNTIISCLNPMFAAPIGKDKVIPSLILSYCLFVILILSFRWDSNLIVFLETNKRVSFFLPKQTARFLPPSLSSPNIPTPIFYNSNCCLSFFSSTAPFLLPFSLWPFHFLCICRLFKFGDSLGVKLL
jgi:hypothetical protein